MRTICTSAAVALSLLGCGTNVFKSSEPKDPAEDATLDLERGDAAGAIDTLTAALQSDPTNTQLLSILALAYGERAGFDPLRFASQMATSQASGSGSGSGTGTGAQDSSQSQSFTALFSITPEATASNMSDLDTAVAILSVQIPTSERQLYDTFKLALFTTGSMVLHLKSVVADANGLVVPTNLNNLDETSATNLINELTSAQSLIAEADPNDPAVQKAAANIGQYQAEINAEPGATNADKLKNFLGSSGAGTSTLTSTDTGTGTGTGL
jgi:hypothetical protein